MQRVSAATRCPDRRIWILIAVLTAVVTTPGCVRRRLTVFSNPPGATVFVDNQPIGTTPCSVDFTYYGTREIRLIKNGYETRTINQPIPAPWYQVPPLDFITDNFWPIPIRDNRTVVYDLQPQRLQSIDEILARGGDLRGRVRGMQPTASAPPALETVPAPAAIETPPTGTTTPFAPPPSLPPPVAPPAGLPAIPPPATPSPGDSTIPAPFRY